MELILDVENTVAFKEKGTKPDPYEPTNSLVMVGMKPVGGDTSIVTFHHNHNEPTDNGAAIVQAALDKADLLIGHNILHDITWLWESGFYYDKALYDTMSAVYLLDRGIKKPLNLGDVALRYKLSAYKKDTMSTYLKQKINVDDMPHDELYEYLESDLATTEELYNVLKAEYEGDSQVLKKVLDITNRTTYTLAKINRDGFQVDQQALESVHNQFLNEKQELIEDVNNKLQHFMGDTPININSPEQLSKVIYSRELVDKTVWADAINPYMDKDEFKDMIKGMTRPVYKTVAEQCKECHGTGYLLKKKKDGAYYKKPNKCTNCEATGFIYVPTKQLAGLRFSPSNPKWASALGFSTNKDTLHFLASIARSKGMEDEEKFLNALVRINALDSYLSNFVGGIQRSVKPDGKLHVQLTQTITATGRFSGREPNMQNMPRGGTFPVKRAFISRWPNGKIMEADFAQLEFRVAAFLSQDETAIREVIEGFDVHSYTAKVITDAGQITTRQEAKAHTFAPLYGATGYGRSAAEARYYEHFIEKYQGIANWHKRLAKEALNAGTITTPSGRQFAFPDVYRKINGDVTQFTQIKNYPVQSFATSDIVPLILTYIDESLMANGMSTCIVNSVHDSIVLDVHPDEIDAAIQLISDVNSKLIEVINHAFNIDFNIPLLLEAKIGDNWLDTVDVE